MIYGSVPSKRLLQYYVMPFKLIFTTREGVMLINASVVHLLRLTSFTETIYSSNCFYNYLSSLGSSSSVEFYSTVRILTPETILLGQRQNIHLAHLLGFLLSVVRGILFLPLISALLHLFCSLFKIGGYYL